VELGEHIRLARRAVGLSRAKLAESIGMHPVNYAKIERGQKNVTFDTLLRIADGLGLDLSVRVVKRRKRRP
jgi:transcriptional regulator with XRE-family HTH domain